MTNRKIFDMGRSSYKKGYTVKRFADIQESMMDKVRDHFDQKIRDVLIYGTACYFVPGTKAVEEIEEWILQ